MPHLCPSRANSLLKGHAHSLQTGGKKSAGKAAGLGKSFLTAPTNNIYLHLFKVTFAKQNKCFIQLFYFNRFCSISVLGLVMIAVFLSPEVTHYSQPCKAVRVAD